MPWTAEVIVDRDKSDVGTATATWDAGGPDEFTYSRRARVTGAEAQAFKVEAIAARDAELAARVADDGFSTTLQDLMNA